MSFFIHHKCFRRRLVFLEDYDMTVSRYLVQGVDVWLNTPLRPNEASGTSGMKAAANGVLNLSTLDGWWDEACEPHNGDFCPIGWAIGRGEIYPDREYQDQVEVEALYDLLERGVIPVYYDRRADGIPRGWIELMKSSIASLCFRFNTHRMVCEYTERFYLASHSNHIRLLENGAARARSLSEALTRTRKAWPKVQIQIVDAVLPAEVPVGEKIRCRARVQAGPLAAEDIIVELYLGRVNADGEIADAVAAEMKPVGREGTALLYEAEARASSGSGRHGYTARVRPRQADLRNPFIPGLIAWAG